MLMVTMVDLETASDKPVDLATVVAIYAGPAPV
jgi:hypothetical protein